MSSALRIALSNYYSGDTPRAAVVTVAYTVAVACSASCLASHLSLLWVLMICCVLSYHSFRFVSAFADTPGAM